VHGTGAGSVVTFIAPSAIRSFEVRASETWSATRRGMLRRSSERGEASMRCGGCVPSTNLGQRDERTIDAGTYCAYWETQTFCSLNHCSCSLPKVCAVGADHCDRPKVCVEQDHKCRSRGPLSEDRKNTSGWAERSVVVHVIRSGSPAHMAGSPYAGRLIAEKQEDLGSVSERGPEILEGQSSDGDVASELGEVVL
jgi:hypothetical protein